MAKGEPAIIEYAPFFGDGMGSAGLLPEMRERVCTLADDWIVMSLQQIADALKLLEERCRVIAEGTSGSYLAAALTGKAGTGKIVCVIFLVEILTLPG